MSGWIALKPQRPGFLLLVALGLCLPCAADAASPGMQPGSSIPGAKNPRVYTNRQFRRDLLAFNLRTTVGAYKRVGKRNPKWNALALKMLAGRAVVYTNYGVNWTADQVSWKIPATNHLPVVSTQPRRQPVVAPAVSSSDRRRFMKKLRRFAKRLIHSRCDDPLALYTAMQMGVQPFKQRLRMAGRVYRLMEASHYSTLRKWAAANYYWEQLRRAKDRAKAAAVRKKSVDLAVKLLTQKQLPVSDQRFVEYLIEGAIADLPMKDRASLCRRAQAAKSPYPWLVDVISGAYQIDAAWQARNNGWASSVTQHGWKGFSRHLKKARALLTKAWHLNPHWPEAPAKMISVTMGSSDPPSKLRLWFNRTVKAQFDYAPAYSNYLWAIYPRWDGSHLMMYRFGVACLNTGRFDTRVPWEYTDALWDIEDDTGSYAFWRNHSGVYKNFVRCIKGRIRATPVKRWVRYFHSLQIAGAWECHQYAKGRAALNRFHGTLDYEACSVFGLDPMVVRAGLLAYTTEPARGAINRSHALWHEGKPRRAEQVLLATAKKLPAKDPARFYLTYGATMAKRVSQLANGEWTTLTGDRLAGWRVFSGSWKIGPHEQLIGTPRKKNWGLSLAYRYPFGDHIELKGHIKMSHAVSAAGVMLNFDTNGAHQRYHYGSDVLFYPGWGVELVHNYRFGKRQVGYKALSRDFDFDLQQWGNKVHVVVNGHTVANDRSLPDFSYNARQALAIGAGVNNPKDVVTFSHLKLRILQQRPAWTRKPGAGLPRRQPRRVRPHNRTSPPRAPGS